MKAAPGFSSWAATCATRSARRSTHCSTAPSPTRSSTDVVDVRDAENIDSTCLGILARVANHARHDGGAKPTIVTADDDIRTLLLAVCFDRLFNLVNREGANIGDLQPVPEPDTDADAMLRLILEAHRRLCAIDARTHAFRDVVSVLEQETKQRSRH